MACDLHPDYASTRYAEELAGRFQVPIVRVQHHHAHVAACMAEHGLDGPVLGLSWDGTGYGPDHTIWGGEALVCQGGEYRRAAHLQTFPLPGGDRAARQPRRAAAGLLYQMLGPEVLVGREVEALPQQRQVEALPEERQVEDLSYWFSERERRVLAAMLQRGINCPRTSSMGRLFDAVAALCGFWEEMTFEGQAAMNLEFAADAYLFNPDGYPLAGAATGAATKVEAATATASATAMQLAESYSLPLRPSQDGLIADWEPMIRQILDDRRRNEPIGRISARFHNALAELALDVARAAGCESVVLTGGCFQNSLLTWWVRQRLLEGGFAVYTHRQVPPGDGGIALGQVFVAARQLQGPIDVPGNSR